MRTRLQRLWPFAALIAFVGCAGLVVWLRAKILYTPEDARAAARGAWTAFATAVGLSSFGILRNWFGGPDEEGRKVIARGPKKEQAPPTEDIPCAENAEDELQQLRPLVGRTCPRGHMVVATGIDVGLRLWRKGAINDDARSLSEYLLTLRHV